jgi:hypothetical protein
MAKNLVQTGELLDRTYMEVDGPAPKTAQPRLNIVGGQTPGPAVRRLGLQDLRISWKRINDGAYGLPTAPLPAGPRPADAAPCRSAGLA